MHILNLVDTQELHLALAQWPSLLILFKKNDNCIFGNNNNNYNYVSLQSLHLDVIIVEWTIGTLLDYFMCKNMRHPIKLEKKTFSNTNLCSIKMIIFCLE